MSRSRIGELWWVQRVKRLCHIQLIQIDDEKNMRNERPLFGMQANQPSWKQSHLAQNNLADIGSRFYNVAVANLFQRHEAAGLTIG